MIAPRKSEDRGPTRIGWLDSKHTFSFGHYQDPRHMGFGPLRVINEDKVAPGAGFDTHSHRDMEILSWVVSGALEHKDSLGTGSVIRPGDLQRMTAGTGVAHSEFNASKTEPVHFLQIWIIPERRGLAPGYEQKSFPEAERRGRLRLIGARDGRDGAVTIHQDVDLYAGLLAPGDEVSHEVSHEVRTGRGAWVQVVRGAVLAGDEALSVGDGLAVTTLGRLVLTATADAEVLLFDLASDR
jgi:redox-sensitive bicupin YhaK (pirin superfamily)